MAELRTEEAALAKVAGKPLTMKLCLWVSELELLRAVALMGKVMAEQGLRKDEGATCYTELYHLDFPKLRQQIEDYEEEEKEARIQHEEEWREEQAEAEAEEKKEMPPFEKQIPARVLQMAQVFESLSKACFFAREAKAWVQLENIVRTGWNCVKFDLTTPLELRDTHAWQPLALIAECVLSFLEHLKRGGALRN